MAGDPETNKQRLREQRARAQRYALPSALPGQEDKFDLQTQTPLVGFTPASILVAADSPVSPTDTPEDFMVRARGFPSQALRSEEHTSELQSLMTLSYAAFTLKK